MAEKRTHEVDATSLRALAHPLRLRILRTLQRDERASATSLAAELHESTGTTSYHLRQLARHGLVEQVPSDVEPGAPARGGAPQRWWRMAVDSIHLTGMAFVGDEATSAAAALLLGEAVRDRSERLTYWHQTGHRWPAEWERTSTDGDAFVTLDPDQTRALSDEIKALVEKYDALPAGPGARRIDVQYAVFPTGRPPLDES